MARSTIGRTRRHSLVLITALLLAQGGCAMRQAGGAEDPAGGTMVADRLFLAEVVTPRFPEGLTVWRAEGQWLDEQ
ncbi:hypothetical protein BH20GEM1_BH20GEM1_01780 [soil metagenome]